MEDIVPKVFRQLLSYVYTGDASKLEDDDVTEPLFVATDKYQIKSLKDWCSSVLQESITIDNAVRYIVLAHLHSDEDLQDQCELFIDREKKVYWERDDFKQLSKTYPDIFYNLCKLMRSHQSVNSCKYVYAEFQSKCTSRRVKLKKPGIANLCSFVCFFFGKR